MKIILPVDQKLKNIYWLYSMIVWNKLSKFYTRCASCEHWGNSCHMNCTSCRDSGTYGLVEYKAPNSWHEGDCIRYSHKCKDLPYFHDYDLAEIVDKIVMFA